MDTNDHQFVCEQIVTEPEYQCFTRVVQFRIDRPLTPAVAREAMQVAFGHGNFGTVRDDRAGYGYRLYPNSHRKFYL